MEEGDPAPLQLWPGKPDDGMSGGLTHRGEWECESEMGERDYREGVVEGGA